MFYEINEEAARLAKEMISFSDYKKGSATAEYQSSVMEVEKIAEVQKQKVSSYYWPQIDRLADSYARRLADWTNRYNRNTASCPSVLICGPANFPTRKKERQNAREDALWKEYNEITSIKNKIKSVGSGPVDLLDPHAREELTERIEELKAQLEECKEMNAYYRKHKCFDGFRDYPKEKTDRMNADTKEFFERCTWIHTPVPEYELTSLRGKIKRTEQRLADLDNLQNEKENPSDNITFDGGEIIRNAAENRLQIRFDNIPDADVRSSLKSRGFHWSPRNKVWQRVLTDNAIFDAKRILNIAS